MNYLNVSRSKRRIAGVFSLGALSLGIFLGTSNQVWAGAGVSDEPNVCTWINCGAQLIIGTYVRTPGGESLPFTTQIYARAGACIRLDVTAQDQGADLEMVLVSPDGTAWRNDNDLLDPTPLIKVKDAPVMGWYSLQVSDTRGLGAQANFQLRYGLYNIGNPNCINPTLPI